MWDKRAEYLDNTDGFVKMVLDQGFGDTKLIDLRLLGVQVPEFGESGGKECKEFIDEWFSRNNPSGTRWGYIVTTFRVKRDHVVMVTDLNSSSNLNAELAEFMQKNNYSV